MVLQDLAYLALWLVTNSVRIVMSMSALMGLHLH